MKIRTLLLAIVSIYTFCSTSIAADASRPNIILIMADDVGWECFPGYGGEDYKTPQLDKLSQKGVRFSNCYSTPICTTSRVKIMTGKYNFRNYTYFGYLDPEEKTFAHKLKEAGYQTAIAGKWQLSGLSHSNHDPLDNRHPRKAGFDEYCLWQLTKNKRQGGERFWSPLLEQNGKILSNEDNQDKYGPDIMSDFVCDFIKRNKKGPFFVYYPTVLVHAPFVPTPDTIGERPRTQAANKPPRDPAERKTNFVAMVNYMDKIVGKIVAQVEAIGQLENTIILFTADNGTHITIESRWQGEEIQGGKGNTTDMGTHVPLIAYWKNKTPKGVVLKDLIDFTDFYTTFSSAAGLKPAKNDPIDGHSFLPQLKGQESKPRKWVFCHYQPYWMQFSGRQFVRTDRLKLYQDGSFFDVPADLAESHDLSKQPLSKADLTIRKYLQTVLKSAPPAPTQEAGRLIKERPLYPGWKNMGEPGD